MTTVSFADVITEEAELRDVFGWPSERALNKQIDRLDKHCRAIIEKSRFCFLALQMPRAAAMSRPRETTPGSSGCWTTGP